MDSSLIPVFEDIQKDGVARRVLEEEGALSWSTHMRFWGVRLNTIFFKSQGIFGCEFKTVLG